MVLTFRPMDSVQCTAGCGCLDLHSKRFSSLLCDEACQFRNQQSRTVRADGGDLKLCQLSPFVLQVLHATNLFGVFHTYASEREAIEAFSGGLAPVEKTSQASRAKIVCIESSRDLLAHLNALLRQAGYEVFTTRYPSDAMILVGATRPGVVIYGHGMPSSDSAIEKIRHSVPNVQVLLLPSDFSTAEASQACTELVDRVRSVLTAQP
jgi:hypothetical protein